MRTILLPLSALTVLVPAVTAFAALSTHQTYDTSHLGRYTDRAGWDQSTKVSVSVLTDAGIVQGDPAGTFRASDHLNRAEFMKIVIGLLPPSDGKLYLDCFPDVARGAWYEEAVCRAKSMGIVRGNVDLAVDPSAWRFEPNRDVQYEEAVKVLVKLYAIHAVESNGNDWYVSYINAAHQRGLDLNGVVAGDHITRGEMARLTVNFLAYSQGDLDTLIAAQSQRSSSSSSMRSSSSSVSSRSSMSSSSSQSSVSSGIYDALSDRTVQSNIVLLGQTSPIIAGAKFFSNNEPMMVKTLSITLTVPVTSIDSLLVYDTDGRYLGTATQQSSANVYQVSFPTGRLDLPRRTDHSVYVRARMKDVNSGGVSGETIQVLNVQITGTGDWSNANYTTSSSETFSASETARATITSVINVGSASTLLTAGSDQLLATFAFHTLNSDGLAHAILQQLRIAAQATNGVTVSNVKLRQEGSDTVVACSITSNVITCGSIPTGFGTITNTENFRIYGDVSVSNANNPSVSLVINEPGTPTSSGDITWTDGDTIFTWLPLSAPVVRGTQFQ